MASSKDTIEAGAFGANTFACGTLRGLGVDVAAATILVLLAGTIWRRSDTGAVAQRNAVVAGAAQRTAELTEEAGAGA